MVCGRREAEQDLRLKATAEWQSKNSIPSNIRTGSILANDTGTVHLDLLVPRNGDVTVVVVINQLRGTSAADLGVGITRLAKGQSGRICWLQNVPFAA